MRRRDFIKYVGLGTAACAIPPVIAQSKLELWKDFVWVRYPSFFETTVNPPDCPSSKYYSKLIISPYICKTNWVRTFNNSFRFRGCNAKGYLSCDKDLTLEQKVIRTKDGDITVNTNEILLTIAKEMGYTHLMGFTSGKVYASFPHDENDMTFGFFVRGAKIPDAIKRYSADGFRYL